MARCTLFLTDCHPAPAQGLAVLLSQEPDFEVAGPFLTPDTLLAYLARTAPTSGLVLLDLHLPTPVEGLALLPRLRQNWSALRPLVFGRTAPPALVAQAAAAGACGFVAQTAPVPALLAAIRAVHTGQLVFPGEAAASFSAVATDAWTASSPAQLSVREREIVRLIRTGYNTRNIAAELALSELTVSTHRRNLMHKLGLRGVAALLRFAAEHEL